MAAGDGPTRLAGRRAAITGGAGGIGRAIAQRLLAEGASVALLDLDNTALDAATAELAAAADLAASDAGACSRVQVDVSDPDSVTSAVGAAVVALGGIDILVNAAAVYRVAELDALDPSTWDTVHNVSLRGVYLVCRAALPHLKASGSARIINFSSAAANGRPATAAYSAAKMGIVGLTRALAKELGPSGITVNAVAPGFIITPMSDAAAALFGRTVAENRTLAAQASPLGRVGEPADVAAAVAFLASSDADFVTGQVLHIDGGSEI